MFLANNKHYTTISATKKLNPDPKSTIIILGSKSWLSEPRINLSASNSSMIKMKTASITRVKEIADRGESSF
jgi:hypothetical protein